MRMYNFHIQKDEKQQKKNEKNNIRKTWCCFGLSADSARVYYIPANALYAYYEQYEKQVVKKQKIIEKEISFHMWLCAYCV